MSRVLTFTNVETGDISKPFTELGGKIGFGSRCELTIPLAMTTDDFYFVLADVFVYRLVGRRLLGYPVEVRHSPSKEYKETPTKQAPLHARPCGVCETYSLPLCYVNRMRMCGC